jgi:hypothetical protein
MLTNLVCGALGGILVPMALEKFDADPAVASRALVLAPPASAGSPGLRRFTDPSDAFASGWMQLRGARRRRPRRCLGCRSPTHTGGHP